MLDLQSRLQIQRDYRKAKFFILYAIGMLALLTVCAIWEATKAEAQEPTIPDIVLLHEEICDKVPISPLCTNTDLLEEIDSIASKKNVPTRLLVGIMYAESSLATNYNKPICKIRNNPYWIKWRKFDDWHVEWFTKNRKADKDGCWLYHFKSIEEATESLINTLSIWYKLCENKTTCIAYNYVGRPDIAESSWISRVAKFYPEV